MEAATEAFILMVVGLKLDDESRRIQRVLLVSSESMRQATVEKRSEKTMKLKRLMMAR
jgi:hypothetical protein